MNKKQIWAVVALAIALVAVAFTVIVSTVEGRAIAALIAGTGCVIGALYLLSSDKGVLPNHTKLTPLRSARWPQYHFWGGPPELFEKYFIDARREPEGYMQRQEQIALVACAGSNGNVYAVERPGRHNHVITLMAELGVRDHSAPHDFFVTNRGRVVGRVEAWNIAREADQLIGIDDEDQTDLYSENLWATPIEYYAPAIKELHGRNGLLRTELLSTLPALDELTREAQAEMHRITGFTKLLEANEYITPLKAKIHSILTPSVREYVLSLNEPAAAIPEAAEPEGSYGVHLVDGGLVIPEGVLNMGPKAAAQFDSVHKDPPFSRY